MRERGAAVIDADAVVHELYAPRGSGTAAVVRLFGPDMLTPSGAVNRRRLGELVLHSTSALEQLNQAIHPLVSTRVSEWLVSLSSKPCPPQVAVIEAALLVETGAYHRYDLLVVVWCHRWQQLERACTRGVEHERADQLIRAQLPLDDKRDLADIVIDNSGDVEQRDVSLARAWTQILERCSRR